MTRVWRDKPNSYCISYHLPASVFVRLCRLSIVLHTIQNACVLGDFESITGSDDELAHAFKGSILLVFKLFKDVWNPTQFLSQVVFALQASNQVDSVPTLLWSLLLRGRPRRSEDASTHSTKLLTSVCWLVSRYSPTYSFHQTPVLLTRPPHKCNSKERPRRQSRHPGCDQSIHVCSLLLNFSSKEIVSFRGHNFDKTGAKQVCVIIFFSAMPFPLNRSSYSLIATVRCANGHLEGSSRHATSASVCCANSHQIIPF